MIHEFRVEVKSNADERRINLVLGAFTRHVEKSSLARFAHVHSEHEKAGHHGGRPSGGDFTTLLTRER